MQVSIASGVPNSLAEMFNIVFDRLLPTHDLEGIKYLIRKSMTGSQRTFSIWLSKKILRKFPKNWQREQVLKVDKISELSIGNLKRFIAPDIFSKYKLLLFKKWMK